ncbi:MAG: Asp23/Gls24 family envelope stress response protein [Lachnospiraceae bacterium]|nr:Asp23/Gls24 family envelope stress response protein [Lachnospiraceae bacterium]
MAETYGKDAFLLSAQKNCGDVQISDDALAAIAGIAATEVEGVASMAGNITNELVSKFGVKSLSKGVKINVEDGKVFVDVSINIMYEKNIPEVSMKVQERVKTIIESMTGLEVPEVRIKIAGVIVP